MDHLDLDQLRARHEARGHAYDEFLRVDSMSAGLYVLLAGDDDPQSPHREDEVYVVVSGQASFTAGQETISVQPGTTIFVPALQEHRFHDITERLEVVVLFAPPETTDADS
jgi:mannose-6-phosphate isomerase-like protein (cupin superfamily)